MSHVGLTLASLRIVGEHLDPDEITRLLGAAPTQGSRKGETRKAPSGRDAVARTGLWSLKAADRSPGDLDAQVQELFARVSADPAVWSDLSRRFRCDIFCGLFMLAANEGFDLEPDTLGLIAARGLRLNLDLYAPAARAAI